MYLSFDEFEDMGGTADETAFENLEFEARAQIDYWTFNRLQNEETLPEAVKRCMYKLITLIQDQQALIESSVPSGESSSTAAQIMSQSNDGVSISYNTASANRVLDVLKNNIQTIITQYLGAVRNSLGQKVLYRGIYPNE